MTSRIEQETVILFNQEEPTATVLTRAGPVVNELTGLGYAEEQAPGNSEPVMHRFVVPRHAVRFARPRQSVEEMATGARIFAERGLGAPIPPPDVPDQPPIVRSARKKRPEVESIEPVTPEKKV